MDSVNFCPYIATWAEFLPGDSPCGEDCSFDEAFEALQAEVNMDTSLHAVRATNWVAVLEMSGALLARSKDIWALAYAAVALLHTRGLSEASAALAVLAELLEKA